MHRREKAVQNKDKAVRLNKVWGVNAVQARYSDAGHWYATLIRFPAALFDSNGYVYFATEAEYQTAPMSIGKQISVPSAVHRSEQFSISCEVSKPDDPSNGLSTRSVWLITGRRFS